MFGIGCVKYICALILGGPVYAIADGARAQRADRLLCGISVCRRLARAASACSRSIVAAVSVEVMLGPGIALIWRGLETRTDKLILIF